MEDFEFNPTNREKKQQNAKSKWVVHKTLGVPRDGLSKKMYEAVHKKKKPKLK